MSTFVKSMTVSIASNYTLSEALSLGENGYHKVFVEVPTMSTATAMRIYGSGDGVSYKYMHESDPTTSAIGVSTMVIATCANGAFLELPSWAPWMKFQVTATLSAAAEIKVFAVLNS